MLGLGLGTRWGKAVALFAFAAALGCAHIWWKAERVAAPVLEYARMAEFTAKIESFQRLPTWATVRLLVRPQVTDLPPSLRVNADPYAAGPPSTPSAPAAPPARLLPPPPPPFPG